eukprot:GGOE01047532.1.p1 GENE.GGOE01047532.1~~GGOE01047532.1.p1  ORF type:complete len:417 (-),score=35.20 GGOE01047532.1:934-2184(-)
MSPPNAASLSGAVSVKAPVDADIRVCLDFIKGRCTRARCKFYHPEMSTYQQLSGVIQAQAGKQICEVWAMAGQCKFGAKCSKLHPVVLAQTNQAVLAIPMPVANTAATSRAMAVVPQRRSTAPTPITHPAQPSHPSHATPPQSPASTRTPHSPLHLTPYLLRSATQVPVSEREEEEGEEEFQDLAQSILAALQTEEEWEPRAVAQHSKRLMPDLHRAEEGSFLASRTGIDRAFLDILSGPTFSHLLSSGGLHPSPRVAGAGGSCICYSLPTLPLLPLHWTIAVFRMRVEPPRCTRAHMPGETTPEAPRSPRRHLHGGSPLSPLIAWMGFVPALQLGVADRRADRPASWPGNGPDMHIWDWHSPPVLCVCGVACAVLGAFVPPLWSGASYSSVCCPLLRVIRSSLSPFPFRLPFKAG